MTGEQPAPAPRRRTHRRVTRPATGGAEEPPGTGTDQALDQTRDDTDAGWGERPEGGDARDRWYLEQRPPHWG